MDVSRRFYKYAQSLRVESKCSWWFNAAETRMLSTTPLFRAGAKRRHSRCVLHSFLMLSELVAFFQVWAHEFHSQCGQCPFCGDHFMKCCTSFSNCDCSSRTVCRARVGVRQTSSIMLGARWTFVAVVMSSTRHRVSHAPCKKPLLTS